MGTGRPSSWNEIEMLYEFSWKELVGGMVFGGWKCGKEVTAQNILFFFFLQKKKNLCIIFVL